MIDLPLFSMAGRVTSVMFLLFSKYFRSFISVIFPIAVNRTKKMEKKVPGLGRKLLITGLAKPVYDTNQPKYNHCNNDKIYPKWYVLANHYQVEVSRNKKNAS